jgi:excisionase family DNA binding protein
MSQDTRSRGAEPMFLRVREFAVLAGISRSFAHRLVSEGSVPSVRIGRAVRIPLEAARVWAARLEEEARP